MAKPLIYAEPVYEGVAGQRLRFDIFERPPNRSHPSTVDIATEALVVACSIESRDGERAVIEGGACVTNALQNHCSEYALTTEDLAALTRGSYTAWLYVTKEGVPLAQQPPPIYFEVERARARPLSAGQDDSTTIAIF